MKKKLLFISILLAAFAFHPSRPTSKIDEKPDNGGHLTIGTVFPIDIINPIISMSGTSSVLAHIIFNGLLKSDENFNAIPDIAYKWKSSENGLKWRFYLRKGALFHDGRELTSEDVKFTYDLIKDPKYSGYFTSYFKLVDRINIIDKYTLEIILSQPYASLLTGLSVGILPKHIYSGKNLLDPKVNQYPVGAGPFKVVSYTYKKAVLHANSDYFGKGPYLDRVVFKNFKGQKALLSKMIDGSVDAIISSDLENIDILKRFSSFKLYKFLKPFYYLLAFKNKEIFKERGVRKALNYAVNKRELLKKVLNNEGKISSGTVLPILWANNKQIKPYPYNPLKAIRLLAKAGWKDTNNDHILDKDGVEFDFTALLVEGEVLDEKALRQIQVDFNKIGITMKTKKYTLNRIIHFMYQRQFDAIFIHLSGRGDPDTNYRFWHSSQIQNGNNFFSYKNITVDKFLEEARRASDIDLRKKFYNQFQEEIFNDPPGIFLFWANNLSIIHERYKGVKIHPIG